MVRHPLLLAIVIAFGAAPLAAQKPPPVVRPPAQPQTQPQPSAPAGRATAGKVFRPSGAPQPAAPAAGAPATPAGQGAATGQPAAAPVTPQSARPGALPAAAAAVSANAAFTAGLAMPPYAGTTPDAALEYARSFGRALDSAIVTLVDVFRNTSGQPMDGAGSPAALSQRERDRWSRCRNLYWDLTSYASAMGTLRGALPTGPAEQPLLRAATSLDSALNAAQAVQACDDVASMIAAPDRWTPWADQYQSAAQRFYHNFYNQIRDVHEHDRAFVNALNGVLAPPRRIQVPAGLPRNPPFAGAAPS